MTGTTPGLITIAVVTVIALASLLAVTVGPPVGTQWGAGVAAARAEA